MLRMPPGPGPWRTLALRRRRKKKARAASAMSTANPPMVPPTMAPVRDAVLVTGGAAASVVSLVALADSEVVEVADVADDEDAEVRVELRVELLLVLLFGFPSVVGSLRVLMLWVYVMLTVGRVSMAVTPLALFCTVAARSLAVPQPYWEYPPSKTFM